MMKIIGNFITKNIDLDNDDRDFVFAHKLNQDHLLSVLKGQNQIAV